MKQLTWACLAACLACSGAPATTSLPAPAESARAPEPEASAVRVPAPPAWVDWLEAAKIPWPDDANGVFSHAQLADGRFATALSYTSDDKPFLLLRGDAQRGPTVSPLAWQCVASPAQLIAHGTELWGTCVDPTRPEEDPGVQFWWSGDAGEHWKKIAVLEGMVGLGRYAIADGALFLAGNAPNTLRVLRRAAGGDAFTETRAAIAPGLDLPGDTIRAVAASSDGERVAIVAIAVGPSGAARLFTRYSLDGGASFPGTQMAKWDAATSIEGASIVDGKLYLLGVSDNGGGVMTTVLPAEPASTVGPARERRQHPLEAFSACSYGARLFGKTARGQAMSIDRGETWIDLPPPPGARPSSAAPQCTARGVQLGRFFAAWPQ